MLVWVKQLDGFYRDTLREHFVLAPSKIIQSWLRTCLNSAPKLRTRKGKVIEPEYFTILLTLNLSIRKNQILRLKGQFWTTEVAHVLPDGWSKGKRFSFCSSQYNSTNWVHNKPSSRSTRVSQKHFTKISQKHLIPPFYCPLWSVCYLFLKSNKLSAHVDNCLLAPPPPAVSCVGPRLVVMME